MARYNEILVGRINRGLQKYFGIKGDAPVPQLAGDVSVNHALFTGVENRYLEGWGIFGATFGVAASPGNPSGLRVRNPAGSNVVAVIEKFTIWESVVDTVVVMDFGPMATDLSSVDVAFRMDTRGPARPMVQISHQVTAPAQTNQVFEFPLGTINVPYELITYENQEIPLFPGDGLQIRTGAVNTLVQSGIRWRERFLEESERT
jgi:hypothetical protein